MTAIETRAPATFAGWPLDSWLFAIRIWAAMMVALYVGFWLQLESASSAAVTVGILALPTRGQALQKAVFRFAATCIGVVASIVIVGLFAQNRDLYVLAFAGWLGICVFCAGFLDGNRAYGAVLSGYTVAVVAVIPMDQPQTVFLAGINRGAAIAVGIASLALINDVFMAPNIAGRLIERFAAARRRVRVFAASALRQGGTAAAQSVQLLREITALHADSTALSNESIGGTARAAAARSLMVALVAEVEAVRTIANGPASTLTRDLAGAFEDNAADPAGTAGAATDASLADRPLTRQRADRAVREDARALGLLRDLKAGRTPPTVRRTPIYRAPEAALRNGLRAGIATVLAAIPFILGGWPAASLGFALVGVTVALSATTPNPAAFAGGALIAMPLAAACAGITEFFVLDGVDQFPLLAIAMAPPIFAGALLVKSPNPKRVGIGTLLLVFFPVLLGPSNPQNYSPQTYLFSSALAITAVIGLYVLLATLLPISDERRRGWMLRSMRREVRGLLAGRTTRFGADEAAFRDADRIGQLAALAADAAGSQAAAVQEALGLFDLAAALRRARAALDARDEPAYAGLVAAARAALAAGDARRLLEIAAAPSGPARREAVAAAPPGLAADLASAAERLAAYNGAALPGGPR